MFDITQGQLFILLLYSAAVGAALGVIYDIFRIFRVAFPPPATEQKKLKGKFNHSSFIYNSIVFLQDIIFWIFSAVVTILFIFMANRGQVRIFALFGQLTGFGIYYFTIGRLVYKVAEKIVKFIRRVFRWIKKRVVMPIIHVLQKIYKKLADKLAHKYLVSYTKKEMTKSKTAATKGFR
ncbi:MAG: spore cortex biosynthesis protein YabQ [Oscillospiraceae bacterium]|nr:spore cortex biosynthesis protein YabQ [Oscillospiraceae bacterium]